jgi:hypothetical protein
MANSPRSGGGLWNPSQTGPVLELSGRPQALSLYTTNTWLSTISTKTGKRRGKERRGEVEGDIVNCGRRLHKLAKIYVCPCCPELFRNSLYPPRLPYIPLDFPISPSTSRRSWFVRRLSDMGAVSCAIWGHDVEGTRLWQGHRFEATVILRHDKPTLRSAAK